MSRAALLLAVLALFGCQKKKGGEESVDADYAADVARICDVEHLSGAEREESSARSVIAAEWLGRHVKTQAGRDFLASLVPLAPAAKAARLRAEARRAGLDDCRTAAAWDEAASAPSAASGDAR